MKKLMALVVAFAVAAMQEAVSGQFAYQGVLKNSDNTAMTGTKELELRLYNAATGGTLLWGHSYAVQLDGNGLFNTVLEYEIPMLKKYAEPLLREIGPDEPEHSEAVRMLKFLEFFSIIEDESLVPNNSIIRYG